MTEIECNCERCRNMCRHSCCLPTPQEAVTLIERGYAQWLGLYEFGGRCFVGPAICSHEGETLPRTNMGRCTFFSDEVGCELHAFGLKPLEGRLAHHDRDWLPIRFAIMGQWRAADQAFVSGRLAEAKG